MDKVYTYSVHWGGNRPHTREDELLLMDGWIALNGRANCNSPLRVCYPNVGKYHVNACKYVCKHTKKHQGLGMRAFACVVGANCNSPTPQFIHTAICPYCKIHPRYKFVHITIHPCGWANCNSPLRVCYPNVGKYHVNACKYVCKHTKKHHGHGMRAFACVVGANFNSPTPQFAHTAICPHHNSSTPQFAHIANLSHVTNSSTS